MSRTAQDLLEFDKLRELLRLRTTSAPGRRAVNGLEPGMDRAALESAFALIREAAEWLRAGRELGFGALADPQGWLERIEGPGMSLEPGEFLDAASLLETAGWLRQQFREEAAKFPLLAERAAAVGDFRDVHAAIRRCVLPNGEISDDASAALRRIRASITETRDSIQKNLKQILRARNAEAGEDYVTLRNDRFVIPVRAEHRRTIPGVVHGASATGQTVFMEPFETVESNNQLVQLAEDEAAEILRILRELTEKLQMIRGPLLAAAGTIAELDSVFARARFARDFDAAIPEFSVTNELRLEGARHPVLEDKLRKENRAIVPMTLTLGGEERVLVISGPNTGGKTVALKTTGMAALAALAVALLDEFRATNCMVLATTHHDRLKTYASTTPGVVNAAVEFDDVNLRPTYRLMVGVPGGSSGIAIAKRLGLAAGIIERARALLTPESREAADLIAYLHRSRDELDRMQRQMAAERHALEEERAKLRTEWVERQQKRIKELEAQFAEMQKRFDENVARVLEAVKERELRGQMEKSARRKMQDVRSEAREELNAAVVQTLADSQADLGASAQLETVSAERLQPGARIRVRGFNKPVIFRRLDGSSAEIEAGPLRMKVAVDEIVGIEANGPTAVSATAASASVSMHSRLGDGERTEEINLIGSTVEEATERVDKFLDDAALAHISRVRIIHGHGTGALRKGLGEFLKTHPLVARQSFETEERGGKAITVVELRS